MRRIKGHQLILIAISINVILLGAAFFLTASKIERVQDGNSLYSVDSAASYSPALYSGDAQQGATLSRTQQDYALQPAGQESDRDDFPVASAGGASGKTELQRGVTQTQASSAPVNSLAGQHAAYPAAGSQQTEGASNPALSSQLGSQAAATQSRQARAPLAFSDTSGLNLNPVQQQEIANLQQNFVDAIGGENQNPSDPAYLNRWETAQSQIDQEFKVKFGWQAFVQQQLVAARQGTALSLPPQ